MIHKMYLTGYDFATTSFSYIPKFENKEEKQEFKRGLKDGYNARKKDKNARRKDRVYVLISKTYSISNNMKKGCSEDNFRKYFKRKKNAKKFAENDFKKYTALEFDLKWYRKKNGDLYSEHYGPIRYHIKKIKIEDLYKVSLTKSN